MKFSWSFIKRETQDECNLVQEPKIIRSVNLHNIADSKRILERDYELFLEGHTNMIKSLVLTNDNKHLIPGDSSGEIRVWNFQDKS